MPTMPPISAPAAAPPTGPVPVSHTAVAVPTIAPPAPPIIAPVPAPVAVFDGATPEERNDGKREQQLYRVRPARVMAERGMSGWDSMD